MEKTDVRETHDFMNVESFSQLPFIRPALPAAKEKGIRLFGKEFGGANNIYDFGLVTDRSEASVDTNNDPCEESKDNNNGESSNRKFECHYCCRNFPTSQALGGHQNAHKRERQHAKRVHLQSTMAHGGAFLETDAHHLYGFVNYPAAARRPPPVGYHHSWTTNRFSVAAGHGIYPQQPINGSPLELWRIPAAVQRTHGSINRDSSMHPLPLFAKDELKPSPNVNSTASSPSATGSRYGYQSKTSIHDHVSLDLRL